MVKIYLCRLQARTFCVFLSYVLAYVDESSTKLLSTTPTRWSSASEPLVSVFPETNTGDQEVHALQRPQCWRKILTAGSASPHCGAEVSY